MKRNVEKELEDQIAAGIYKGSWKLIMLYVKMAFLYFLLLMGTFVLALVTKAVFY